MDNNAAIFAKPDSVIFYSDTSRDPQLLCIVETPADLLSIEQTHSFHGRYFVLMGHLSPLDGIGPQEIWMDLLKTLLSQGNLNEVILATNLTVEGEATAYYIAQLIKAHHIKVSRIAHGGPLGSELEYTDNGTLTHAVKGRGIMI